MSRQTLATLTKLLTWGFWPFYIAMTLFTGLVAWWLFEFFAPVREAGGSARAFSPMIFIPALVGFWFAQAVVVGLKCVLTSVKIDTNDPWEVRVPHEWIAGIYGFTAEIAQQHRLMLPHEIRLHPFTVAHVYQTAEGQRILVLGGLSLALLPKTALAALIAHELQHFTLGDTTQSRWIHRFRVRMIDLYASFFWPLGKPYSPLIGPQRLYHLLFLWVEAALSRKQEYQADQASAAAGGKLMALSAVILVEMLESDPYLRLSAVADGILLNQGDVKTVFKQQVQRARSRIAGDWVELFRKAYAEPTSWEDSHPSLKDRLSALGVSKKEARQVAADIISGKPAAEELVTHWSAIEAAISDRIIGVFAEMRRRKDDVAAILTR